MFAADALNNDEYIPKLYSVDNNMDPVRSSANTELIVILQALLLFTYSIWLANWLNNFGKFC